VCLEGVDRLSADLADQVVCVVKVAPKHARALLSIARLNLHGHTLTRNSSVNSLQQAAQTSKLCCQPHTNQAYSIAVKT
jgi:hypothetical protein